MGGWDTFAACHLNNELPQPFAYGCDLTRNVRLSLWQCVLHIWRTCLMSAMRSSTLFCSCSNSATSQASFGMFTPRSDFWAWRSKACFAVFSLSAQNNWSACNSSKMLNAWVIICSAVAEPPLSNSPKVSHVFRRCWYISYWCCKCPSLRSTSPDHCSCTDSRRPSVTSVASPFIHQVLLGSRFCACKRAAFWTTLPQENDEFSMFLCIVQSLTAGTFTNAAIGSVTSGLWPLSCTFHIGPAVNRTNFDPKWQYMVSSHVR